MAQRVEVMTKQSKAIVFVVVCILLAVPLSGCLDGDDDDEPEETDFTWLRVYSADMNGTKVWHVRTYVHDRDGISPDWLWEKVVVTITGPDGTDSVEVIPEVWNGEVEERIHAYLLPYDEEGNRTVPYNVTFNDEIRITGIDDKHLGGTILMQHGEYELTQLLLPSDPSPDGEMRLEETSGPHVTLFNDTLTWRLHLTPEITKDYSIRPFWDTIFAGIVDVDGSFLVDPVPVIHQYRSKSTPNVADDPLEVRIYATDEDYVHVDGIGFWDNIGIPDRGDSILITGLRKEHEGGNLVLYKGIDKLCESPPISGLDHPVSELTLGEPVIENKVTNDSMFHNAYIDVVELDLSNDSLTVPWSVARVLVTDMEGGVLGNMSVLKAGAGDFCSSFEASSDDYIDEGDKLLLKGLDLSFRGANLELFVSGSSVDNITIPEDFNITGIELSTSMKAPENRTVGTDTVYDITVRTWSRRPSMMTIPWDQVEARVVDRINDTVLLELARPIPYDGSLADEPEIFIQVLEDDNSSEDWKAYIHLSALDRSYEGSYLELFIGEEMVGWERLDEPFNLSSLPVTFNLASPNVKTFDINHSYYYEAVLNINKISPRTADVYWDNVTIRVISWTGSLLVPETLVIEDPWAYDEDDTDGIDIGIWFVETGGDDKVNAGDAFRCTGLTIEFEGAVVQIFYSGELVGSSTLPTDFM